MTAFVELWGMEDDDYLGFITPFSSGVTWSNQIGGTSCQHPSIEGIFLPLPAHWRPDVDPALNYYDLDPSQVQAFLEAAPELLRRFEPIPNFPETEPSGEAWVPVRVRPLAEHDMYGDILRDFVGMTGVLTYPNSD